MRRFNWRFVVIPLLTACLTLAAAAPALALVRPWPARDPIGPEQVAAWTEAHAITGLDANHWAAPSLVWLIESGFVQVQAGATLDLDAPIPFGEAAVHVLRLAKQLFIVEVPEELTPAEAQQFAVENGLIADSGVTADQPLTRLAAAQVAAGLTGFAPVELPEVDLAEIFTDAEAIPAESRGAVYWVAVEHALFVGHPDGRFAPDEPLTYGQYFTVLERLVGLYTSPMPELQGE